ncbi:hypothetical protein [Paraburkholderia sp. J41]|uniref:AbiU2 domain-containing protein n=1 Tax=Paraburkholderia sp. J41 TaxID=2805433 RepID=UPI002AC35615|nr:hypothetical protein [Paraburkholderia sp. J41]
MNPVDDLIEAYRDEVNVATSSFYTWKSINDLAAANDEILRTLNANALVWNIIAHSLQVTFFVALGRIFDRNQKSLTALSFIEKCRAEIGQFSKSALEARRLKDARGARPEWLDGYLAAMYEPAESDFDALAQATQSYEATYRARYQPIRHKVIAHKDLATIGSKDALFKNTNIGEVENMLQYLKQVEQVVEQWYLNGRNTNLADHSLDKPLRVHEELARIFRELSVAKDI